MTGKIVSVGHAVYGRPHTPDDLIYWIQLDPGQQGLKAEDRVEISVLPKHNPQGAVP